MFAYPIKGPGMASVSLRCDLDIDVIYGKDAAVLQYWTLEHENRSQ